MIFVIHMRKTPLYNAVVDILKTIKQPITVAELNTRVIAAGLRPNLATLYRMLERLVDQHIITQVLLDSKTAHYEINTHHHHHFVCEACDRITCVSDERLENSIHQLAGRLKTQGMQVLRHDFLLAGRCHHCA